MKSFLLLSLVTVFLSASSAFAEGGQTHGGTAIVCRAPGGAITRAEILDLFEARELLGLKLIDVKDVAAARAALLADLRKRYVGKSVYPAYLEQTLANLHPRFKVLGPKVRLELIPDVFPRISEKGCAIEQLASFQDKDGVILLDAEIFAALTPLERLALEFHESVYYLDRKWANAKDSVFSRKLVGFLLANQWAGALDAAIGAYAFGLPRAGEYGTGTDLCHVRLEIGSDGTLRITPTPQCRSVIAWNAFVANPSAVLKPSGRADDWKWRGGSSELHLVRQDDNRFQLDATFFDWIRN